MTVFDFEPLWAITQIYPENSDYETVDPGDSRDIELDMMIPEDLSSASEITDTIKAFITLEPTSFRTLEMPDINPKSSDSSPCSRAGDSLERLLEELAILTRHARARQSTPTNWETSELTIRTRAKFAHKA